jgi:hypothetical protein
MARKSKMAKLLATVVVSMLLSVAAIAEEPKLFVVAFPHDGDATEEMSLPDGMTLVESFAGTERSYAVFGAPDEPAVRAHLAAIGIEPITIMPVEFINSPVVGGGRAAGAMPRADHQVYVIERPIPGVGSLPLETKQMISQGSNAAIEKLGDTIEWDHSYLTSEGTFCVYRAEDEAVIREHARLAGAPVELITPVVHTLRATAE